MTIKKNNGRKGAAKAALSNSGSKVYVSLNWANDITFRLPGKNVTVYGPNSVLRGEESGTLFVGEYATTPVNKEDWEQIQQLYGNMPIFKNRLIFANETKADAKSQEKEMQGTPSGLDPANPGDLDVKEDDKKNPDDESE